MQSVIDGLDVLQLWFILEILKVSLQEAPTELRPQMDCYMLHYVLTSTNVSQMQLTTLGRIPSPL